MTHKRARDISMSSTGSQGFCEGGARGALIILRGRSARHRLITWGIDLLAKGIWPFQLPGPNAFLFKKNTAPHSEISPFSR